MKYDRIESLRVDHDYKIKDISQILECNRDVYSRYEKGLREIPVHYVIKLAEHYNVSIDYLLGCKSEPGTFGDE